MGRRIPLAALLTALALGGCGGPEEAGKPAVDRTSWKSTFEAAMDALTSADRTALLQLLNAEGRIALDADLKKFGENLADPLSGPRLLGAIRERWPEVPDALIEGARKGDLDDAWRLWQRAATPPGVRPQQAGMKVGGGNPEVVELLYRYDTGKPNQFGIRLRRHRSQWSIDDIDLGSPPPS